MAEIEKPGSSAQMADSSGAPSCCSARMEEKELSFYISNHDQSPVHRVIHPIVGKTNFVFDAKGVMENIRGEAIALLVKDSQNITVRNVIFDWERPTMTEARITGFADGETVVEVDGEYCPMSVVNGRLFAVGPGWTNLVRACRLFDGATREQMPEAADIRISFPVRQSAEGRFVLKHDFSKCGRGMKVGDILAFRPPRRDFPAMVVYNSKNVVFEDVVVHDAKGMALIAQRSENVTWRGSRAASDKTSGVFPRPGAYSSTHADASHFSNVRGLVTVENCWFEGMMDDAINIHSTCLAVTNVSGRTLTCRYMHHQAVGFEVFLPGEKLRFINGRKLETGPEMKVVDVKMLGEREVELTLDGDIPDGWGAGDAVENADYQPAAIFRNNVIVHNRARGSLFTTPRPILIESNLFVRVTGAPLLFSGDDYYWYESGACRDVVIRGNVFSNCYTAAGGYSKGILSFYPVVREPAIQEKAYHGNILVEDNLFHGFDAPLLFALSVENLLWRNNRYEYNTLYRGCEEPPFVLRKCRNVTIDGRKCAADTCFVPASGRVESDFGGGWMQKKEDGAWSREKTFTLPPSAENQMVFLDIVGKGTAFEVALNGMSLGSVNSSQASVRINLTPAIKRPGEENHIVFKCRDRAFEGRAVKLVRTAPVHIGFKGVGIDAKTQNDGSVMVEVKVDVKGPLPFVKSINAEKGVWGGDVRVESRVIGEEGLCIRKPKTVASGGECPYRLETKLYYVGDLVDVVTNTFKVGFPRGAKTHSSGVAR